MRKISDNSDDGIDGQFRFIPDDYPTVFTNGTTSDTPHTRPVPPSKSGYVNEGYDTFGSRFSENKYDWTDNGSQPKQDNTTQTKISSRKICVIVLVTIFVLCILAGVAVILAYKVFGVWGK